MCAVQGFLAMNSVGEVFWSTGTDMFSNAISIISKVVSEGIWSVEHVLVSLQAFGALELCGCSSTSATPVDN